MYDRATNSLWHQFTGTPIIGELQGSGIVLDYFPTARTTWGEWVAEHPDTTVLALDGAHYAEWSYLHEREEKSIYWEYRADPQTMFPIFQRDPVMAAKAEVLGVSIGDIHKAYRITDLMDERIVHDRLGDLDVVVIASGVSSDAHIYDNSAGIQFELAEGVTESGFSSTVVDSEGREWLVDRNRLVSADDPSMTLPAVPSNVSFWFGWFAYHPDTLLYNDTR